MAYGGRMGFMGPPSNDNHEKLKEPLPKNIREIPGYLKKVTATFFTRLGYIMKLIWEAKKSLMLIMIFMATFNGISPVLSAYISANLLNNIAKALALAHPTFNDICSVLLPAMLLQFGYMFLVSLIHSISNMVTRILLKSTCLGTSHLQ